MEAFNRDGAPNLQAGYAISLSRGGGIIKGDQPGPVVTQYPGTPSASL